MFFYKIFPAKEKRGLLLRDQRIRIVIGELRKCISDKAKTPVILMRTLTKSVRLRLTVIAAKGNAAARRLHKRWMKLKSEPVRESRQVVENPDYVRDL